MSIERWLPFKSHRKKTQEKAPKAAETTVPAPLSEFFHRHFSDPLARAGDLEPWFGDFSPARFQPTVDVVDEEESLRVTAELPGMAKDDIHVSMDDQSLTIRGEKQNWEEKNEQGVYRTERYFGSFQRVIPLPTNLDATKAKATFGDGVLTIRLPKTPITPESSHQIPIDSK